MPALAAVTLALIALALLAARLLRGEGLAFATAALLCGAAMTAVAVGFASRPPPVVEAEVAGRPVALPASGYVTSSTCRACHPREYATWHASYHRSMTQLPGPGVVLGDFDGVTLQRLGQTFSLERRPDGCWIELDDPMAPPGTRAPRIRRKVSMTTGSHNMQLYWYETGYSRVTALLPFVWLVEEGRWIPRQSAFILPPSDRIDPEFGQWTLVCVKCHATHGRPRADMDVVALRGADTHVSEFGIACEACHGPAAEHVARNRDPRRRYAQHLVAGGDPTIVHPGKLDHRRSTQVCGQCHGNFDLVLKGEPLQDYFRHGFAYRPGDDLEQTKPVSRHGWDEQFWSDGVPRAAGREYNGMVGSGCYERGGMSCLSCHAMHRASDDPRPMREWAEDQLLPLARDQACLQCHPSYAEDVAAHTHHAPGSEGSRCYNCHMPHSSYGLLKGVRNHRIDSPDVATETATGRPNACNQCHLDRSLAWTAGHLQQWYGIAPPRLGEDQSRHAAAAVWALQGDAAQRALAAWNLGWQPALDTSGRAWTAPYLAELLDDPYEAVRVIAERSLRRLPGYGDLGFDLLGEPAARAAARQRTLARWRELARPFDGGDREAVLISAGGGLLEEPFRRLLQRRDLRVVRLLE